MAADIYQWRGAKKGNEGKVKEACEKAKLTISDKEYSALNAIRGLSENAHYLVMTANGKDGRWTLDGTDEAFDELLGDLNLEIEEGFAPRKNIPALARLCRRLASGSNPYELDF